MGALLVGLNFAKALAYGLGIPLVGVNHMEAHIYANLIDPPKPGFPFLCLVVSGGHTQLVLVRRELEHELLGETLDDAAGEAYDKVAKMLGLGFPGGPAIDKLARGGNASFVRFPRSLLDEGSLDFSFSGVKTAVLYWLRVYGYGAAASTAPIAPPLMADLCASFQEAVVDVLVEKVLRAAARTGVTDVALAGGVSANSELRRRMRALEAEGRFRLFVPAISYCTDNAAMIAMAGHLHLKRGAASGFDLTAVANLSL
jgi:N6-L-threonylcarbamoyladenine synthase